MNRYKIILSYDGTDYFGWQVQDNHVTVAGTLQKIFKEVFGQSITLIASSRTDAGVHALGQTAAFSTDLDIDPQQMLFAWQNRLPESIYLKSIESLPLGWNPRADVAQKTYHYDFFIERPLPFAARYGWYYHRPLDVEKLKAALALFQGTHDFRSFCTGQEYDNTVRTIISINLEYIAESKFWRIKVCGPGFLRYMIRRIVGACLAVASHENLSLEYLKDVLAQKNPQHSLPTAPAQGLLLYEIRYTK